MVYTKSVVNSAETALYGCGCQFSYKFSSNSIFYSSVGNANTIRAYVCVILDERVVTRLLC
jgi:hypothetical protein